ncbi:phosphatase [Photobacterium aquae]|uniref:Phosphatase n=1 Tax=Photobacterium aquae TaxID=1195763 RepID=A0A0J1HDD7_9GAMM|nr:6-phosphogluconate phosphatase [Photobacterium aquae]KLV09636.1 phosphatase [Photobacterium aquae]
MEKKHPTRCVIFDCDGTLVDSEILCNQALVNIFTRQGGQLSLAECIANFQGGKIVDILAETKARTGVTTSIDELEPMYREECRQLFEQYLKPIDGIPELLATLEAKGIDMCIASNGPVFKMKHALGLTQLMPYFEGKLFSGFDASSWKPDPDLLHYAAMHMGYRLQDCVFVDDTVKGIQAGINADVPTFHYNAHSSVGSYLPPQVTTLSSMLALLDHIEPA